MEAEIKKNEVVALPIENNLKTDTAKLDEETQKIVFEHIEKKKTELAETEARLDRKTQELRAILNEMKQEGRGVKSPEQNDPEAEAKKAAMKLIAGSGFENKIRL